MANNNDKNTLDTVLSIINIINVAGPSIINLIQSIKNADPNKPIGEILKESGILWDENIKQAEDALKR